MDILLPIAGLVVLIYVMVVAVTRTKRALIKRPEHWLVTKVGHQWWTFAAVYVLTCIPARSGWPDLARLVVGAVAFGVMFGAELAHGRVICQSCIDEWPLDAPAQAEERRSWLQFFHRSDGLLVLAIIVIVTASFLVHLPSMAFVGATALAMSLRDRSRAIHTPLQPWCPVCGDDDGGDDEVLAPEPDPRGAQR